MQSTSSCPVLVRSILILSSHVRQGVSCGLLLSGVPTEIKIYESSLCLIGYEQLGLCVN
jgi:hypothetical protein